MTTQTIIVPPFEPGDALANPGRTWTGWIKGDVPIFDTDYGTGIYARFLWVAVAGNVAIKYMDGTSSIFKNMPVGKHEIFHVGILSAGTTVTADNLLWGY